MIINESILDDLTVDRTQDSAKKLSIAVQSKKEKPDFTHQIKLNIKAWIKNGNFEELYSQIS